MLVPGQGSGRNGDYYLFRPAGIPSDASMVVDFVGQKAWRGLAEKLDFADALSCSRANTALAVDSAGVWHSFGVDEARVTDLGLLVEPAATNGMRNSAMTGSVAGSPGTMPTNYAVGAAAGLTRQMLDPGEEDGLPFSEWRFSGTASGTVLTIAMDSATAIGAASGDTWTGSMFARLTAAGANIPSLTIRMTEISGGGSTLSTKDGSDVVLTSGIQRVDSTKTLDQATTASVRPWAKFSLVSGQAYDFTVRLYVPQMEKAAASSSPILTTSGAATRAADAVTLTLPAGMHDLTFTFDDDSTQTIAGQSGTYAIPTSLNRRVVKSMTAVAA